MHKTHFKLARDPFYLELFLGVAYKMTISLKIFALQLFVNYNIIGNASYLHTYTFRIMTMKRLNFQRIIDFEKFRKAFHIN